MIECYKVLIYTLMQWNQYNPFKIFDVCQSSITSNAQIFKWSLYDEIGSFDYLFTPDIKFDTSSPPKKLEGWCIPFPYFFDGNGVA